MSTLTVLYIIIAIVVALSLALFQYKFRSKRRLNGVYLVLFILRFLTIFAVLLLLINPKFEQSTYYTVRPNLVVAIDNSESIVHLEKTEQVRQFLSQLKQDEELMEKFNIQPYTFGASLQNSDSLNFNATKSNLSEVFERLGEVYDLDVSPTIVVSDGNQTFGQDYVISSRRFKQPVYPVIVGDTVVYTDLKIQQLNANRYSYLNNRFPVEIIAVYDGTANISTQLNIRSGNTIVYSQPLQFSPENNSEVLSFTLPATSVGIMRYRAELVPLEEEKNKVNNYKDFAVEIINQKTNVALVSDIVHPDLGAIKKSIESNQQRSATIVNRTEFLDKLNDYQMAIIYQPSSNFKNVYDAIDKIGMNKLVILGTESAFNAVNTFQTNYSQEITNQIEDYVPILNRNYSIFNIDDINFSDYPPLKTEFGSLSFSVPNNILIYKSINGIQIEEPLLATFEINNKKEGLLNGEGIWKWRAESYLQNGNFEDFDDFFGKLIQYLSTNVPKSRLSVTYESIYRETDEILVSAQYYDQGYEFDPNANLTITLKNTETENVSSFPLILSGNGYQIDLSGLLEPGDYDFTISVKDENLSRSGKISILDYNVEQQFLNADIKRLSQVAENTGGEVSFIDNYLPLLNSLKDNPDYRSIQKSNKNIVPLVDWKYLLAIIALSLALEWFIRKYNGLV
ncbi:MAG: VWA domain-containing protein [Flavobacteriaceae bacterium]|nr:VWA domain-containing protein [Flavobacteriaceae bacterium]